MNKDLSFYVADYVFSIDATGSFCCSEDCFKWYREKYGV